MRWTTRFVLLGLALFAGRSAVAQEGRPAIAVLPFADGGSYGQDRESFAALESGIQATLLDELGRNPAVRIVERAATRRALGDADVGARGRLDAATAARIGKSAGARYVVFGGFVDLYGRFRLNARIVDVETGEILKVVSNDDPKLQDRQHLHQVIRHIAARVVEAAGLPAVSGDAAGTVPTDALTHFSRGLLHEDRGERAQAAEAYRRALEAMPGYPAAQAGLRRVGQ